MFSKLRDINIFDRLKFFKLICPKRKYVPPAVPSSVWQNPWHFIAFGFGTGAIPIAPGTCGTLIAIPIYLYLCTYSYKMYFIFASLITLFSIWLCGKVSAELEVKDHQGMCLDEIVGFLVTMLGAPAGWGWIIIGFILFRCFDIWKPWPLAWIDTHITGGLGMILDDVAAGLYSLIIMRFFAWMF